MSHTPRLSIGLPVYNGQRYVAQAIDTLLSQTYRDFELIISDNASTDATESICRRYARLDSRIRYLRQPRNIGSSPNHNIVADEARGELFKWAGHDDRYAPELLRRCVEALDEHPDVVLSHAGTTTIDDIGNRVRDVEYRLTTDSPRAAERFGSVLFGTGGDDSYGVIRTEVLRKVRPHDSFHHAEHALVAELALHGPFYRVPEYLYFRRDHPGRAERANPTKRRRSINMDPRRESRWRHPTVRLLAEYAWALADAVHRAPIPAAERRECYRQLARWLASRAPTGLANDSTTNQTRGADHPVVIADAAGAADSMRRA